MPITNSKCSTLETGGKSPLIIFEDADLEQAVKWGHLGIMSNMGQICTATSRILVQESIYDKVKKITKFASSIPNHRHHSSLSKHSNKKPKRSPSLEILLPKILSKARRSPDNSMNVSCLILRLENRRVLLSSMEE